MTLRLRKRNLRMERIGGEGSAQTVAEGSVRLPERYPAIGRPLELIARPVVTTVEPTDDRVLIEGVVRLEMTYVSFEDEPRSDDPDSGERTIERLHRVEWDRELSFAYLLEVPGATDESRVEAEAHVANVSFDVRSDETTVDVDVLLRLSAVVSVVEEKEVTVAVSGEGLAYDTEEVRIRVPVGEERATERIAAALPLAGRSLPEMLLDVKIVPALVEVEHVGGSLVIRGQLDCSALYVGGEGAGVQFVEWPKGIAFQIESAAPEVEGTVHWAPRVEVNVIDYYVEPSDEGAVLRADFTVSATATAIRTEILSVVTDIRSEQREVAYRIAQTELYEAVGEGSTRSELQSVLELPDNLPPIDRMLRGRVLLVVEEVHVLGDKVAVEGQASLELTYVARGDEGSEIHTARWPYAVTFDIEIPVPGAEPGLDRQVRAAVRRLEFDLINRETVEARIHVAADARIGRLRQVAQVAEAVELETEEGERATFTFVVTNEDDTLWKLAQLYRTTVEAILAHNEGLDPDAPLGKGRKICIIG